MPSLVSIRAGGGEDGNAIEIINQLLLPHTTEWLSINSIEDAHEAIKSMKARMLSNPQYWIELHFLTMHEYVDSRCSSNSLPRLSLCRPIALSSPTRKHLFNPRLPRSPPRLPQPRPRLPLHLPAHSRQSRNSNQTPARRLGLCFKLFFCRWRNRLYSKRA